MSGTWPTTGGEWSKLADDERKRTFGGPKGF